MSCAKKRIILVGDHKQLPQFINEDVAKEYCKQEDVTEDDRYNIKNISMFEHLTEKCKLLTETDGIQRFIMLDSQFRMKRYLGDIINKHFYEPDGHKLNSPRDDKCFKHNLPGMDGKCLAWLDAGYETEVHVPNKGYYHMSEAKAIAKMLSTFLKECPELEYGVISLYREQVRIITTELADKEYGLCNANGKIKPEYANSLKFIGTVDACQGLQFDVVFVSLVRTYNPVWSNPNSYQFLNDQHRLCVALSRQKKALLVTGSRSIIKDEVAPPVLCDIYKRCLDSKDENTLYVPYERRENR